MRKEICLLSVGLMAVSAPLANAVDNVILFIGDGMGQAHITAGRAFVHGTTATRLTFESLGVSAESVTTLPGGAVTDSATAGTAIATGYQHPANGVISMGANNSIKPTVLEWAKAKGMRTAIITTDDIGGATPGAFGAHEPDRTLMAAIRADYLRADTVQGHGASLPDVLLGGGYNDPAIVAGTSFKYVDLALSQGYQVVSSQAGLLTATAPNGRLLGLFGTSWAPMEKMAGRGTGSTQPTLSQMLTKTLELMGGASYGFLLVVESANIDKLSHSNDETFVAEVAELNAAVETALAWKANNSIYANTHIMVTADHETGGLSVPQQTITAGTLPAMTWSSTGHTAANVPMFATWPPMIAGDALDNTYTFFIVQDALQYSRGGQPPIIEGLAASGLTETSATVQWTTVEPSGSQVTLTGGGRVLTFAAPDWGTSHSVRCTDLTPGTTYAVTAASTDLVQFTGTATASLTTPGGDPNAYVISAPVVGLGTVSGTYQGVLVAGDGLKQSILEVTDGVGSGLLVDYTLHTPAPVQQIDSLTLQASLSWTGGDGAADGVVAYVRVLAPDGGSLWEQITFPFAAEPAGSYVDASGSIVVRFEDGASIKRERKDTLAVDCLFGSVVKSTQPSVVAPSRALVETPTVIASPLSVSLSWSDSTGETGYQVWRHSASGGWKILAEPPAGARTLTDSSVSPSTTYNYVVRALNPDAYADSDAVPATTPMVLAAPASLKASVGKTSINLSWTDTNTGETGYEVLRGTTPAGNFTRLILLAANATSHADKNALVRGTTYYYQVRAIQNGQPGPVSNTVSALR